MSGTRIAGNLHNKRAHTETELKTVDDDDLLSIAYRVRVVTVTCPKQDMLLWHRALQLPCACNSSHMSSYFP